MKRALVIGASGGIGHAICQELGLRKVDVVALSRRDNGLNITDEASIESAFGNLNDSFDLVFVATGALVVDGYEPEKTIKTVTPKGMANQFAVNAIGPMLILKHALPRLSRDKPWVFAALSARVGSIGDNSIGGWTSYRSAKAALNQALRTASIEIKRTHPKGIVTALHPGTVATSFTKKYAGRYERVPPRQAAADLLNVVDSLTPEMSGQFFDYSGAEIPW